MRSSPKKKFVDRYNAHEGIIFAEIRTRGCSLLPLICFLPNPGFCKREACHSAANFVHTVAHTRRDEHTHRPRRAIASASATGITTVEKYTDK